jgi:hypothetical protein
VFEPGDLACRVLSKLLDRLGVFERWPAKRPVVGTRPRPSGCGARKSTAFVHL